MRVRDVYEALKARLTDDLRADGAKIPSFAFGESEINKFSAAPRVGFVPRAGATKRTDNASGDPDALWKRGTLVELHVWAKAAETLAARAIAALDADRAGHYLVEGERWDTSGDTQSAELLIVDLRIYTDWSLPAARTVEPTDMEMAQELNELEATG